MRNLIRRLHEEEDGQVMILVAILMVGMVAVVGLVTMAAWSSPSGGTPERGPRSRARRGIQIDESAYRASAGETIVLERSSRLRSRGPISNDEDDLDYSVTVELIASTCRYRDRRRLIPTSAGYRRSRDRGERNSGAAPRHRCGGALG